MRVFLRSLFTAVGIAGAVQLFAIGALAPRLPAVLGRPAVETERALTLPGAASLSLLNVDGSVHIRTHALDGIEVQASIRAYVRETENETLAQNYVASLIATDVQPESVSIVTEPGERPDAIEIQADYNILVPMGTDIAVAGANGNVWVSAGCGRVKVHGCNADIEVVEPRGLVTAESTNGRIRVLDAVGGAEVSTVNGNVYAYIKGGGLRASTTNGAIVAHRLVPGTGGFDLSSANGGITLVMADECAGRVDAETNRGLVKSDFPLTGASTVTKRRQLQGDIGSGDTTLKMRTLNGNIWIARNRT
ncbi:MAG: hypothetical protein QG656_2716 [Candidatus Hydrogenedentes bacterium]|nr:hypothetical protein [Candidatus Hydrogenedentota bacterium]